MTAKPVSPPGWHEALERSLDLEAAYLALEGYDHFHTYTLKGHLRHHQLRLEDALTEYDRAEVQFSRLDPTPDDRRLYGLLLGSRLSTRLFKEARSGSSADAAQTDADLERFLAVEGLDPVDREKNLGFFHLVRGEYQLALEEFEAVIEARRTPPERSIGSYICAAAAAHEIGLYRAARRHYENAELTVCCHCNRFLFCMYLTWLLAISVRWGWHREAQRWEETIRVLECPSEVREALFQRARVMERISSGKTLVLA